MDVCRQKAGALERASSTRLNALPFTLSGNQPQHGSPMPQQARALQQAAASSAMPGDAANAAELETSMVAAANSFIFIF